MRHLFLIPLLATATAAFGHTDVANPAVKARMASMMEMAGAMKTMVRMSRGEIAYDPAALTRALDLMEARAGEVPKLFAAPESDPQSEASAEIWQNFADFTTRAEALQSAVIKARSAAEPSALPAAMGEIAKTCKSCHGAYKL